jgi:hypothetical protein
MYGKVQYHTPIPPHVPVKVNTVTCAGKGFVTSNIYLTVSSLLRIIVIIYNGSFRILKKAGGKFLK